MTQPHTSDSESPVGRGLLTIAAILAGVNGLVGLLQTADLAVVLSGGRGLLIMTRIYPGLSLALATTMAVVLFVLVKVLHRHYGVTALTALAALLVFFMLASCGLWAWAEWFQLVHLREVEQWVAAPLSFISVIFGLGLVLPQFHLSRPIQLYGLTLLLSRILMNQYTFSFAVALTGPLLVTIGGLVGNGGELILAYGLWRERRTPPAYADLQEEARSDEALPGT